MTPPTFRVDRYDPISENRRTAGKFWNRWWRNTHYLIQTKTPHVTSRL